MNNSQLLNRRLLFLAGFLGVVLLLFLIVMYQTQIVQGSEYRARSMASNADEEVVEASRGTITDRNGKVLVSNRLTYTLRFSGEDFTDEQALNSAIWRLLDLLQNNNVTWNDSLPLLRQPMWSITSTEFSEQFVLFAKNKKLPGSDGETFALLMTGQALMDRLVQMYHLEDYTPQQARLIAGVRYELDVAALLDSEYVLADDVAVELIGQVVDGRLKASPPAPPPPVFTIPPTPPIFWAALAPFTTMSGSATKKTVSPATGIWAIFPSWNPGCSASGCRIFITTL